MDNRDQHIIELQKQIEEKESNLNFSFKYKTKASVLLRGVNYNFHVMSPSNLEILYIDLEYLKTHGVSKLDNVSLDDYLTDINNCIRYKNIQKEKEELKVIKQELDSLISQKTREDLKFNSLEEKLKTIL